MKVIDWLMPLGMVSAVAYFVHVLLGQYLWESYDPLTTDISSLTAIGAPNAHLLNRILLIYGICFLLFVIGMVVKSFEKYHGMTRIGYLVFLVMAITTVVGYKLFPLTGDKADMNFQNTMHIVVTILVVFTTISSLFLIGFGYLKQEKLRKLGKISIATAVLITLFGALNPIGMAQGWNVLGLTERMVIFPLQAFVFFLSFIYTTNNKLII
ncbi:hypothetical protein B835_330 [Enterococcus mundtii 3F]|uniref:DUF998 domain-containing protein n=1 Tax=Enterococcus mundtii TaxID=53346 RepID=UPI0023025C13|nr:DUF998 domain-containing protein [Enterococcus mundtii]MDA9460454.1 hypothetical protein [Enterococcus mundtii 3F]